MFGTSSHLNSLPRLKPQPQSSSAISRAVCSSFATSAGIPINPQDGASIRFSDLEDSNGVNYDSNCRLENEYKKMQNILIQPSQEENPHTVSPMLHNAIKYV